MENNLRHLLLDPDLIRPPMQDLLSAIAAQSKDMDMSCYLVGGFVRDLLLQQPINDLDIIIEGDAIQLGDELVRKHGGKLTAHQKFGTAVWFLPDNWINENSLPRTLDLITARSEIYPYPGALPIVTPSTIEDDIARRDFTINTMALRLDGEYFGEFVDLLDGREDLARGIIRALHSESFIDDPTRIFRAVRYEQRYGFKIDDETLRLINRESLDVLTQLSGERIRHEFDLIFEEENAALMLSRLRMLGVLELFGLPEFKPQYASLLNFQIPAEFDLSIDRALIGYLLWLIDLPKHTIHALSKRFDFTFEIGADVIAAAKLKKDIPVFVNAKPSMWAVHLEKFPPASIYALWLMTKESALGEFLVKWRHIKALTTGDDLKKRGIVPSPKYKEILSQLRAAWLDGEVRNEKEEQELLNTLL